MTKLTQVLFKFAIFLETAYLSIKRKLAEQSIDNSLKNLIFINL